jgi:hypothetical protein
MTSPTTRAIASATLGHVSPHLDPTVFASQVEGIQVNEVAADAQEFRSSEVHSSNRSGQQ